MYGIFCWIPNISLLSIMCFLLKNHRMNIVQKPNDCREEIHKQSMFNNKNEEVVTVQI